MEKPTKQDLERVREEAFEEGKSASRKEQIETYLPMVKKEIAERAREEREGRKEMTDLLDEQALEAKAEELSNFYGVPKRVVMITLCEGYKLALDGVKSRLATFAEAI